MACGGCKARGKAIAEGSRAIVRGDRQGVKKAGKAFREATRADVERLRALARQRLSRKK